MPAWDSESAKEAAAKSAEVRRRRAEMTPAERVRDLAAADADASMRDLIKAAHGKDEFEKLAIEKRVDALKSVLAYGVGRPTAIKTEPADNPEPDDPPEEPSLV